MKISPLRILRKRWTVFVLLAAVIVAIVGGLVAAQNAFRSMTNVSGLSEAQFNTIAPGNPVNVVLEVASMPSANSLAGNILESDSDGTYHQTLTPVNIAVASDASVVMGQLSDVKPGAVLQVEGQRDKDGSVTAQRLVILTSYVSVR